MSKNGTIDQKMRDEITSWATKKAFDRAKELGKVRPDDDSDMAKRFDSWLQSEIWHYEKMAYLKIHNRESRMKK
jgi:hypothetical protein